MCDLAASPSISETTMKKLIIAALAAVSLTGCVLDDAIDTFSAFVGEVRWVLVVRPLQADDDARPSMSFTVETVGIYSGHGGKEACMKDLLAYADYIQREALTGSRPLRTVVVKPEGPRDVLQVRYPDNSGREIDCDIVNTRWKSK